MNSILDTVSPLAITDTRVPAGIHDGHGYQAALEQTLDRCMRFAADVAIETTADLQTLACHQQWLEKLEDAMTLLASPDQLLDLLVSAPTPYAKGLIAGICAAKIDVATISGRL